MMALPRPGSRFEALERTRQASLCQFRDIIGFNIGRIQRKLASALNLILCFGTKNAATEWTRIYKKSGPRWVERDEQAEELSAFSAMSGGGLVV